MYLEIIRASGKAYCRGQCKNLPEFISPGERRNGISTRAGTIKAGTMCLSVSIYSASGGSTAYYCQDCMEQIWVHVKSTLDPKLRTLK